MKTFRMLALCLVAVFAMSALTVASASASPEYGRCLKVATKSGSYANASCTKLGGTKAYQWYPAHSEIVPENLKSTTKLKPKTTFKLETVTGAKVICTSATGVDVFNTANSNFSFGAPGKGIVYEGCTSKAFVCQSPGSPAGTITTNEVVQSIGWLSQANKTVAVLFALTAGEPPWMEFDCAGGPLLKAKVYGNIEAAISSKVAAGKMALTETVKYSATKGKQIPQSADGFGSWAETLKIEIYNGAEEFIKAEEFGFTMTIVREYEEPWEINPLP